MKGMFVVSLLLICLVPAGAALADTLTWTGNGDYNNDSDWEDDANWDVRAPQPTGLDDVVIRATKDMGNSGTDTRTITVNDPADVYSISVPLTISETRSGYYQSLTSFHERYNVLRLEDNMTVDTMDVADQNFELSCGPGAALRLEGAGATFATGNLKSDDATANLIIDGPDHIMRGGRWGAGWSAFRGSIIVKAGTLLGGNDRRTIFHDPLDLIPDIDGGNFFNLQSAKQLVIEDGAMWCCRLQGEGKTSLPGGVLKFEGEGRDVDGDATADGGLCFTLEEWFQEEPHLGCSVEMTGDGTIGVKYSPNLQVVIEGNVTAPAGGCTLTKSGVGVLQLDGQVGTSADNIDITVAAGQLILNGDTYGNITVEAGAALVCSPSRVFGAISGAGAVSVMGRWTGLADGETWGLGGNWSEGAAPTATAFIGNFPGPIKVNAPANLESLITTSATTVRINADMTINHTRLAHAGFTFDVAAGATLTIDNDLDSNIQNVTGPATADVVKTGIGRLSTDGVNWPFEGTLTIDEGMVGEYLWGNGCTGSQYTGYFPNASVVITGDGMVSMREDWRPKIAEQLTLDGNGLAVDPFADLGADWNIKKGAIRHYIYYGGNVESYSQPVEVLSDSSINVSGGWYFYGPSIPHHVKYTGDINGAGALTKMGDCVLSLNGDVANVNASGDSVIVAEGALKIDGRVSGGDVTVNGPPSEPGWVTDHWVLCGYSWADDFLSFQPSICGIGTIDHELIALDGSWLFPRTGLPNSRVVFPSDLAAGDATINICTWEADINAVPAEGVAGTNWNLLTVTAAGTSGGGDLEIAATAQDPVTVRVVSLSGTDAGLLAGFDNTATYTWVIAQADSITGGGDPAMFAVDATDFMNDLGSGSFSVAVVGSELQLTFDPSGPVVESDVTGDRRVTILDLIGVRNHLHQDVNSGNNSKYDVNEDGKINVLDLICVRNRLAVN